MCCFRLFMSSHALKGDGVQRRTSASAQGDEWGNTCMLSQYTQASVKHGTIDFKLGQPAPSALPVELLQTAALSSFGSRKGEYCDPLLLQYSVVGGHFDFRAALSEFLMHNTRNLRVRNPGLAMHGFAQSHLVLRERRALSRGMTVNAPCCHPQRGLNEKKFLGHGCCTNHPCGTPND